MSSYSLLASLPLPLPSSIYGRVVPSRLHRLVDFILPIIGSVPVHGTQAASARKAGCKFFDGREAASALVASERFDKSESNVFFYTQCAFPHKLTSADPIGY